MVQLLEPSSFVIYYIFQFYENFQFFRSLKWNRFDEIWKRMSGFSRNFWVWRTKQWRRRRTTKHCYCSGTHGHHQKGLQVCKWTSLVFSGFYWHFWEIFLALVQVNSGDLNSKLTWMANFYLFGILMVPNWLVWTIQLATMVKKNSVTKHHLVTKIFTIWVANY